MDIYEQMCLLKYPVALLQLFPEVAKGFIDFLWRGMTPALAAALTGRQEEVREALFDLFAPYALQNYNREIQLYR